MPMPARVGLGMNCSMVTSGFRKAKKSNSGTGEAIVIPTLLARKSHSKDFISQVARYIAVIAGASFLTALELFCMLESRGRGACRMGAFA